MFCTDIPKNRCTNSTKIYNCICTVLEINFFFVHIGRSINWRICEYELASSLPVPSNSSLVSLQGSEGPGPQWVTSYSLFNYSW